MVVAIASITMALLGVGAAHAMHMKQFKRVFAMLLDALATCMLYKGIVSA